MFKILQDRAQNVHVVWIRDQRQGGYEESIPSTLWFQRLGVLVNIQGQEKLYDFDLSVPYRYVLPWFLRSSKVVMISEGGCIHKTIRIATTSLDNKAIETHHLRFDSSLVLRDSLTLCYTGAMAERFRSDHYGDDHPQLMQEQKRELLASCFATADTACFNDCWDESEVQLRACGISQIRIESVDTFLVFKLKNELLDKFKTKVFSTVRRSDMLFEGPFQMLLRWNIILPPGYTINDKMVHQKFGLEGKFTADFGVNLEQNVQQISASLICHDPYIPLRLYPKLIQLLDDLLKEINRDLVLKRHLIEG